MESATSPAARPPRRTRAEQATATRAALLDAAHAVFLREGFHGATLDAVAAEAGLTKGAVYSRFDGKADLFFALLERRYDERIAELDALGTGQSLAEGARAVSRQWLLGAREQLDWVLLAVEFRIHVIRHPELQPRYRAAQARLRGAVTAAVERAGGTAPRADGLTHDDVARMGIAVGNALALEQALDADPRVLEAIYDAINGALARELGEGGAR
jgi:AcrR family transcriptional regulator